MMVFTQFMIMEHSGFIFFGILMDYQRAKVSTEKKQEDYVRSQIQE